SALYLAAGICFVNCRQHGGELVRVMGDGVQVEVVLVVVGVTGRDSLNLGLQGGFHLAVIALRPQNVLVLGGVRGGPDHTCPARKEHRAGGHKAENDQDDQGQDAAHQDHVGVGGDELRRLGCGGLGLFGGG